MDYALITPIVTMTVAIAGYVHMRFNAVEKEVKMAVSESEVKEMLSFRLEAVQAWQALCEKRLDRIEESLDRLSSKIDQLIMK